MVYAAYLHRALSHNEAKICLYVLVRILVRTILPKRFVHWENHFGRKKNVSEKKEHCIIFDKTDARRPKKE